MKYLLYLSSAVNLMTTDQLIDILKIARRNNSARNVTGMLLYSEGSFIQVLEGESEDVDATFAKIQNDGRHKGILKLIEKPIDQRNFADWSMGFAEISTDKAKEIEGYLTSPQNVLDSDNNHSVIGVLKTFITSNNMTISY